MSAPARRVALELDGVELLFRPLGPNEAAQIAARVAAAPEDALDIALDAVRGACVSPLDDFDRLADAYPLAFAGDEGVLGELMRLAQQEARDRIRRGVQLFKAGDRNLGRVAESLLAFKAYQGGDYGAAEFAGALAVAEWLSATKGVFNLVLSLLKGLSRRR